MGDDEGVGVQRGVKAAVAVAALIVAVPMLYVLSRDHFLVFHGLIELAGVAILSGIFVVAWNARRYPNTSYLLVVGNTALCVSAVLLVHVLAYKGMNVFPEAGANLATQLWLVSRYLLAGGLLFAPLFHDRGRVGGIWTAIGLAVTGALMYGAFEWAGFPDAYIEGEGLTAFKVGSEYVVIVVLAAAAVLLWQRRNSFERRVFRLQIGAVVFLIGAELAFTLYTDVYGMTNFSGHVLQAAGFTLLYLAVVRVGISQPMALVFRKLHLERDWMELQNRRFQSLLDELPLPYQSLDEDGRIVTVNEAWQEAMGRTLDDVQGHMFEEYLVPDQRSKFQVRFATFKSVGRVSDVHWDMIASDGAVVATTFDGRISRDATGGFVRTHCVIHECERAGGATPIGPTEVDNLAQQLADRTRELEELTRMLQEADRVKSGFLANMSHELRTPLNSIIGFSGVLLQGLAGELGDEQRRQLEMVNSSGRHLLQIVDDLLDLSKIEAGAMSVDIRRTDIFEVCREILASQRLEAEARGLEVRLDECGDPDCTGAARVDEQKLRQILYNLLNNAIKFTDAGSVTLQLDCDRDKAVIRVIDTGIGIDDEDLEAVFEEFEQVSRRFGSKPQGTGLGLAISRRLARMMGGDLTVESAPGAGSTFSLVIPMHPATD